MRQLAAAMVLLVPFWSAAQPPNRKEKPTQQSFGNCSPNIINNGPGSLAVQLIGSCSEVDLHLIQELNDSLRKFLLKLPKLASDARTIKNLNDLLDKRNVEFSLKLKEVQDWITKYSDLEQRLREQRSDDELSEQAVVALRDGDLDRAERILKDLLTKEEKQVDRFARDHFNLAELYQVQFKPLQALPQYAKAYQYRPGEFSYAHAYAHALEALAYPEAEKVFLTALQDARRAFGRDKGTQADVSTILNDLAVLYTSKHKPRKAEETMAEALSIERQLALDDPPRHLPYIALSLVTLGKIFTLEGRLEAAQHSYLEAAQINRELVRRDSAYGPRLCRVLIEIGFFFHSTNKLKEAEAAFQECITVQRQLVKDNATIFLPGLISGLQQISRFYFMTGRLNDADLAYGEAVQIARQLAKEKPPVYLSGLAMLLGELGAMYGAARAQQADEAYQEGLRIIRQLVSEHPGVYDGMLATTLCNIGVLDAELNRPKEAEASFLEALKIERALAEDAGAHRRNISAFLLNIGHLYTDLGRMEAAEKAFKESISIDREMTKEDPDQYELDLAVALMCSGDFYALSKRAAEAETAYREALSILREVAKDDVYQLANVAATLNALVNIYIQTKQQKEAEEPYRESLSMLRQFVEKTGASGRTECLSLVRELVIGYATVFGTQGPVIYAVCVTDDKGKLCTPKEEAAMSDKLRNVVVTSLQEQVCSVK